MKDQLRRVFMGRALAMLLAVAWAALAMATLPVATSAQQQLSDFESPGGAIEPPIDNGSGVVDGPVCTFYLDRASFDAAFPGLPIEDFEEGNVAPGAVASCPAPLNENSNNACFSPGDILPGVEFSATGGTVGQEIALLGAGFAGNPSINVVANTFVESWIIDFAGAGAAGMDLVSYFSPDTVNIQIFGASGLLDSTTASATNGGAFWGVAGCGEPITQITIDSPTDQAEGVDNVAFGSGTPAAGPLAMLLLVAVLALGSMAILLRRRSA